MPLSCFPAFARSRSGFRSASCQRALCMSNSISSPYLYLSNKAHFTHYLEGLPSSYVISALSSPQAPFPGFDVHALRRRWTDTGMSNSGTKEPSPQTSTAQSPPEPQRRGRGRPRKQQQVGTRPFCTRGFLLEHRACHLSLSLSRSRLDHRLQSGLEDDQKAARTKAPKLHRRLSPTTVTLIIEWALNAELGPEMTWDVFSSNQITAVIRFHAFTCTSGIR